MSEKTPSRQESLTRALEYLAAGEWQRAHEIVQEDKSALAAWMHGIVHTIEGDLDNARYWYRRATREFPGAGAVKQEIAAARALSALRPAGTSPRSRAFCTLSPCGPGVRGTSATTRTWRGTLNEAMRPRQWAITSSSVSSRPGRGIT